MNYLETCNKTIVSTEVADMIGKEHKYLMRDIRRYTKHMEEDGAQISPSEFWTVTEYLNSQNKVQPCYLVTVKGCEFIAHKLASKQGTVFTARYINRFHEMEESIKQHSALQLVNQEPKYLTTDTKCPTANPFYVAYHDEIDQICKEKKLTKKQLFHKIMSELSKQYDLVGATRIYKKEMKRRPTYSSDIIGYFPELYEAAGFILETLKTE